MNSVHFLERNVTGMGQDEAVCAPGCCGQTLHADAVVIGLKILIYTRSKFMIEVCCVRGNFGVINETIELFGGVFKFKSRLPKCIILIHECLHA